MKDLDLINFKIAQENEEYIDDDSLKNILNLMNGKGDFHHFLYFIIGLAQRQSRIEDFSKSYDYYLDLITRALKFLNLEGYSEEKDIIVLAILTTIAVPLSQNFFREEPFIKAVQEIVIGKAEKYSATDKDILFICWYTSVIKILKMALVDFHGNNKIIKALADYANNFSERMNNISFENKEVFIS